MPGMKRRRSDENFLCGTSADLVAPAVNDPTSSKTMFSCRQPPLLLTIFSRTMMLLLLLAAAALLSNSMDGGGFGGGLGFFDITAAAGGGGNNRSRNLRSQKIRTLSSLPKAPPAQRTLAAPIDLYSQSYASLYHPSSPTTETPVFWHVPKAGGTAVENLYSVCLGLVIANEVGGNDKFDPAARDESLTIFSPWTENGTPIRFVNVDTTTLDGLNRAAHLHLAESGLADVIFTSYIHAAAKLFTPTYQGRIFTILRHPVDRAVSMFYYLQDATWEKTYSPETKSWSIEQYASSDHVDRDWMVRMILGEPGGLLTEDDLHQAKEILQSKFLIGLITKMEESVSRFDAYFGFDKVDDKKKAECAQDLLGGKEGSGSNKHVHPKVEPGSSEWNALADVNRYDMQLYEFAVALFEEQALLFDDSEDES